jgi:chromosome partitioning protein
MILPNTLNIAGINNILREVGCYIFDEEVESLGKIMAVTNQKGGVGKTTTSVNLACGLAMEGKRVLLVDIDPQGNATSGMGIDRRGLHRCIYNVLIGGLAIEKAIVKTKIERLSLLPATIQLAGAEVELATMEGRERKLKESLGKIKDQYDFIIIDCPPSLGLLTINALTASDSVLVPIQCEYYALEGLSQLMHSIFLVRRSLNPELKIEGILLTMFDGRTNLSIQVVDEVKKHFKHQVYKTIIPRNIRLSEAPSYGKPIMIYDPKSKGAEVYQELVKEVLERA